MGAREGVRGRERDRQTERDEIPIGGGQILIYGKGPSSEFCNKKTRPELMGPSIKGEYQHTLKSKA